MGEEPFDSEEAPCSISSRTRRRRMKKAKKRVEIQEEDDDSDQVSDDEGLNVEEADDLNSERLKVTARHLHALSITRRFHALSWSTKETRSLAIAGRPCDAKACQV